MSQIELGEDMRVAGQCEKCVLLVKDNAYWEVLHKVGDGLIVQSHNAQREASWAAMQAEGYEPKEVIKIIKANGTWMYSVTSTDENRPWWYVAGQRMGGPRGKTTKPIK